MTSLTGFGLGLRPVHYTAILEDRPEQIDWLEVLSENYMVPGGRPLHTLERIRKDYPVVLHGVSLSIGATSPLDRRYLRALSDLACRIEPAWVSDHLCWTGRRPTNLHDLLPLPYTEEALNHVTARVARVQDILRRQLVLENTSSYVTYRASTMTEWEFLAELATKADCLLLLDVNNVYVNAINHGFDPVEFIDGLPAQRVRQIHLAGHTALPNCIIDTHDAPVADPVWDLYGYAMRRLGAVPTMIERDDAIPPLAELISELERARALSSRALREAA